MFISIQDNATQNTAIGTSISELLLLQVCSTTGELPPIKLVCSTIADAPHGYGLVFLKLAKRRLRGWSVILVSWLCQQHGWQQQLCLWSEPGFKNQQDAVQPSCTLPHSNRPSTWECKRHYAAFPCTSQQPQQVLGVSHTAGEGNSKRLWKATTLQLHWNTWRWARL